MTVPPPPPDRLTVRAYRLIMKVAVTDRAASIVTTHAPEPTQSPLQPVNDEPTAGIGISVTSVPW